MEEKLNNILSKLYNGEINSKLQFPKNKEFLELSKAKVKLSEKLMKSINESEKAILNEYMDIEAQITSIDSENQFILGFKLATQIICAGLSN